MSVIASKLYDILSVLYIYGINNKLNSSTC